MNPGVFWYGKLPAVGDFASRRWPTHLIEPWDQWLASEIQSQRSAFAQHWLSAYLQSPIHHFALEPGCLGAAQRSPVLGVLMPSVDKVGRYFPLAICAQFTALPTHLQDAVHLLQWLQWLDDVAAQALHHDWPIATLEDALLQYPAPQPYPASTWTLGKSLLSDSAATHGAVTQTAQRLVRGWSDGCAHTTPKSWWWSAASADGQAPLLSMHHGLPQGADFAALWGITAQQPQPFHVDSRDE